jgi:signal transduction histidine kinase
VDINEMINTTLKMIKPLAETKDISLVFESFRPIFAEVDQVKLSMAISNLVENAVKYNNIEGWVHVSLNADQTYFYIKVQDNGYGISKDAQPRIFDRFYRTDKARDRAAGGTGLGLSIARRIVLAHNGEIKVFSEENIGTTFSIQIPLTYMAPRRKLKNSQDLSKEAPEK